MRLGFLVALPLSLSHFATSFLLETRPPSNPRRHRSPNPYPTLHPPSLSKNSVSPTISSMASQSDHDSDDALQKKVVITDLARYAIKGLSGDLLESVVIPRGGVQTFPDDRRFALLKATNRDKFDEHDPEWLHKEHFLCAFSAPELMASFQSHYEIVESESSGDEDDNIQRLLTLYRRNSQGGEASSEAVLGPIDLSLPSGRDALASFFSHESQQPLVCVTKQADQKVNTFQFGNTRAGVKHNPGGDTRTVHIVNRATIREFSEKTGLTLHPMRFRPNIVIDGLDPWEEFNWVGKSLKVVPKNEDDRTNPSDTIVVKVLTKTVRCEGIGIDPLDPSTGKLDMPKLLSKHYPEHGPYLGVYASLEVMGGDSDEDDDSGIRLSVGDTLELL